MALGCDEGLDFACEGVDEGADVEIASFVTSVTTCLAPVADGAVDVSTGLLTVEPIPSVSPDLTEEEEVEGVAEVEFNGAADDLDFAGEVVVVSVPDALGVALILLERLILKLPETKLPYYE